jgi:hypothetical protein
MPSISLTTWATTRRADLDEIENAHRSVGGTARGRRYATQQINQAYAVLLSSQFQGFCRDLHSECADFLAGQVTPTVFQAVFHTLLTQGRKLDRENPNPGNIGSDYNRFGLAFWPTVHGISPKNQDRQALLEELNVWRNAIAHQDFDPAKLGGRTTLTLEHVRRWRGACSALASEFDQVMHALIRNTTGSSPW